MPWFRGRDMLFLVLGVVLSLKDEILRFLVVLLDWVQAHAEGVRIFVTQNWRHYRDTLAPSDGPDIIEIVGIVLIALSLGLIARRLRSSRRAPN